jgi:tryptophan-rich sensory protein
MMKPWIRRDVLIATAATLVVAFTGGALTRLDAWYFALKQPSFKPPDWVFGPAWTLLFILITIAAVWAWRAADETPARRRWLLWLFSGNAVCNVVWSGLYFFLRRPDWALIEVVFLWLSIVLLIVHLWPYCRRAAWLLVPYLAWVSFAAVLNLATVRLNAPFGT